MFIGPTQLSAVRGPALPRCSLAVSFLPSGFILVLSFIYQVPGIYYEYGADMKNIKGVEQAPPEHEIHLGKTCLPSLRIPARVT